MSKLFLLFSILIISSCNSNNEQTAPTIDSIAPTPTYEETKMSLEEKEKSDPLSFLKLHNVVFRQNLLDQWVVEGTVYNHATVAKYKDVVLDIICYTKTRTELGRTTETLYEFVQPNNYKTFKFKTAGYKGTALIGVEIKSAVASD
jgi:hypothetical protein